MKFPKLFIGIINDYSFTMKHNISHMNSCNPKIEGVVKKDSKGSVLEISFCLDNRVKLFLILFSCLIIMSHIIVLILFSF